jgi:hypothetical protein
MLNPSAYTCRIDYLKDGDTIEDGDSARIERESVEKRVASAHTGDGFVGS